MKHFHLDEWLLYKNKLLSEEKQIEMENHLYTCDSCMDIFLSLINDDEIDKAATIVPENFTENILKNIGKIKPIRTKKSTKKGYRKSSDFFLYYAAVASVAIILTAGGVFGKMVDLVPQISVNMSKKESQVKVDTIYNFSESITNRTSQFINNFGIKEEKED